MKQFVHWVFDLDGTVIDSSASYEMSVRAILLGFGVLPTDDHIRRAYQFFDPTEYFATVFRDPAQVNLAVEKLVELNHQHAEQIPAFARMEELFQFLRSKQIRMSVWTGRDLSSATKILQANRLHHYFELCVSRNCVPNNKPFPDGLLKILTDAKHSGDEVVMIGDHEYDMRGAQAANVTGISVNWEKQPHSAASKLSHRHFEKVEDLITWAQELYPT